MTPWVVVVLIVAGTVVVLAVLAAVTFLTARGFDPEPIVQLSGTLVAAAAASGNFVLSMVKRKSETKVEAHVGVLSTGLQEALQELDRARGRHAPATGRGPAPAALGGNLGQDTAATQGPMAGAGQRWERYSDTPPEDLRDTAWFRQ